MIGQRLPDLALPATDGERVNLSTIKGRVVVFIYPYTGRPGTADPKGWDGIAGAHGSTPQALGFSTHYAQFSKLDIKVFGLSFQDIAWQQEFVLRNQLRFSLLSDEQKSFSTALRLETFRAGHHDYLRRRTLIALNGIITQDQKRFANPAENATDVLKALTA
jgi:peroxiredoxin